MRKLAIAAACLLALAIPAGLYLTPDTHPVDQRRHELAWHCFQSKPCQAFTDLFR